MISVRISQMNDDRRFSRERQSIPTTVVVSATPLLFFHIKKGQEEKPYICTAPYIVFMIAARSSK